MMEKEQLQLSQMLGRKIAKELCEYKRWMKKQTKTYIFDHAFEIDSMICIYENLMEMSRTMDERQLKQGIRMPNLLRSCYEDWVRKEDDITQEQIESICETMEHFPEKTGKEGMETYEKVSGI